MVYGITIDGLSNMSAPSFKVGKHLGVHGVVPARTHAAASKEMEHNNKHMIFDVIF